MMKKIIICIATLLCVSSVMAQQISHTIQRGETLESIARKYNITVESLKQANSNITELFYVGMKIEIPAQQNSASSNVQTKENFSETTISTPDNNKLSQSVLSDNNTIESLTNKEVEYTDMKSYTVMFNPENKMYGLRLDMNGMMGFGLHAGIYSEFFKNGRFFSFLGFGFSPVYVSGPLMIGGHLYPYVNLYDHISIDENKKKTKLGYGAALDLTAGVKVYTTKSGKAFFLTGSYHVEALEFKTNGAFKGGLWGIGISETY